MLHCHAYVYTPTHDYTTAMSADTLLVVTSYYDTIITDQQLTSINTFIGL